jgi:hypothetical protein
MKFDQLRTFLGHHSHIGGGILDGDDGFLLLREDDAAVEKRWHDVVHDQVNFGLAHLLKVFVEVGSVIGAKTNTRRLP